MPTCSTTVTPAPATEPGAIDGFAIDCTEHGHVACYSIESMARTEAQRHRDYFAGLAHQYVGRSVPSYRRLG